MRARLSRCAWHAWSEGLRIPGAGAGEREGVWRVGEEGCAMKRGVRLEGVLVERAS